jgi:hypothetical protein
MSEWLSLPKLKKEDIEKWQPSLVKHYPNLVRYFVDTQKLRVTVLFEHQEASRFIDVVKKRYGSFTPSTARKAAKDAIKKWMGE